MKIYNDVLEIEKKPILVTGVDTTIRVCCNYPKTATLLCSIDGYSPVIYFPLVWTGEVFDNMLIFSGKLLFNKSMIDYIAKHKKNYLCFKMEDTVIENKQEFTINYASIERVINALPNTYMQLERKVNILSAQLDTFINGDHSDKSLENSNALKGMVPIAIDNNGRYTWDFPFIKEKEQLKQIVELMKDVSKQLALLNNRVNTIEQKLMNHIYEGYE